MNAAAATGAIIAGLALLAGAARADREEWRVAVVGSGIVVATETLGASGDGIGIGGRVRVGVGLANPLEVAAFLGYSRTQAVKFPGAGEGGQRGILYADLDVASVGVELRLELGVETWRAFERLHPFLSLRGGLLARRLSGQALLNDRDMTLLTPADDLRFAPAWGGSLGVAHRFGNHLLVSLVADALFADVTSEKALGLEVAWAWY